jgi:membrane protein
MDVPVNNPTKILHRKPISERIKYWLKTTSLPGFHGISINYIIHFFVKGFRKGSLVTRASAIAFNLLLGLLPSIIFLFTLIPYIPIPNFQSELLQFFKSILPANVFSLMDNTLTEIITEKRKGLLILMFLATIIFSTNGIHAIINAFIVTSHKFKTRTWFSQRIASLFLVFFTFFLFALAVIIMIGGRFVLEKTVKTGLIEMDSNFYLISGAKWLFFIILILITISTLYYEIPAEKKAWHFFSPGSIMATILFLISSLGFTAYVNNFGQYNKLYGSIGTIMVLLLWLYFNSISLLVGFELNASIETANKKKDKEIVKVV